MIKRQTLDLFLELVKTSFKMRYQNSVLGFLWVLIKPYSQFIVMYFVWTKIINQSIPDYSLYLLIGIIIYTFIVEIVVSGQMSLLERANIILKVDFPREIAIFSALMNSVINFFINFLLVLIIMLISTKVITLSGILMLSLVMLTILTWGLGLAFFTSVLTVRLRDLRNIFDLGLFLLYWVTPILFSISSSIVPSGFVNIVAANPVGIIINQVRAGFGIMPDLNFPIIFIYLLLGFGFTLIGWLFFKKNVQKIAEFF